MTQRMGTFHLFAKWLPSGEEFQVDSVATHLWNVIGDALLEARRRCWNCWRYKEGVTKPDCQVSANIAELSASLRGDRVLSADVLFVFAQDCSWYESIGEGDPFYGKDVLTQEEAVAYATRVSEQELMTKCRYAFGQPILSAYERHSTLLGMAEYLAYAIGSSAEWTPNSTRWASDKERVLMVAKSPVFQEVRDFVDTMHQREYANIRCADLSVQPQPVTRLFETHPLAELPDFLLQLTDTSECAAVPTDEEDPDDDNECAE